YRRKMRRMQPVPPGMPFARSHHDGTPRRWNESANLARAAVLRYRKLFMAFASPGSYVFKNIVKKNERYRNTFHITNCHLILPSHENHQNTGVFAILSS